MPDQLDLFRTSTAALPEGFRYASEVLAADAEDALITEIRKLPLREFEFRGYTGRRRTVSFGWTYDFASEQLRAAEPIPAFLIPLREIAAAFAWVSVDTLQQVLVSEYGPGAGIGWHRDKPVFDQVIGISLLSACRLRLRRRRGDGTWERSSVRLEPRSAYLLGGPARAEWEHSIPEVDAPRYSITFRSLRSAAGG